MITKPATAQRDALISSHVEIARRISMRIARRCPDQIAREDLVAAGMLGLTEAAERYDATRAEPFLAFAERRIRGAVLDELRRGDIMPRRQRAMARKINATIDGLERATGKRPDDQAIAGALGVSAESYRTDLAHLLHVTVGALDETDDSSTALRGETRSPEAEAARSESLARVKLALSRLEKRDATVLAMHYLEELTYAETAKVLGVTTARICQLHARAITRLRAEIAKIEVE